MSRYFFHMMDGKMTIDDEGTECRDLDEVRVQAVETAGAMLQDSARKSPDTEEWEMNVTDEEDVVVFKLGWQAHMTGAGEPA